MTRYSEDPGTAAISTPFSILDESCSSSISNAVSGVDVNFPSGFSIDIKNTSPTEGSTQTKVSPADLQL